MTELRKRLTGNIVLVILALAGVVLLIVCGLSIYGQLKTHEIRIAVGKPKSDTFAIMHAMKTVLARHYPHIRITLHETSGTEDNLNRLGWGSAELAVSQSDADAPPVARTVAVLFEDVSSSWCIKTRSPPLLLQRLRRRFSDLTAFRERELD